MSTCVFYVSSLVALLQLQLRQVHAAVPSQALELVEDLPYKNGHVVCDEFMGYFLI